MNNTSKPEPTVEIANLFASAKITIKTKNENGKEVVVLKKRG